ncbi:MAG TPA: hypothetical protein VHS28_09900 [Chloroflexota bacterium]|nr:hypothetical protein [Chloroflexota bacterium]
MYGQASPRLRPMGIGDILDEVIRQYRRNFRLLIGIGLWPFVLLAVVETVSNLAQLLSRDSWLTIGMNLLQVLVMFVVYSLVFMAVTFAASSAYLGESRTRSEAWHLGLRRFWASVGLSLLAFLLVFLMAITIIGIPVAIYFGVCWTLSIQAMLFQGLGPWPAMRRSRALVRGSWWRTALILFLLSVMVGVIQMAFSVPQWVLIGVAVAISGPAAALHGGPIFVSASVLSNLIGVVSQLLILPFSVICMMLLYYDLRVRKEGFDLELRAREMGGVDRPPVDAPNGE